MVSFNKIVELQLPDNVINSIEAILKNDSSFDPYVPYPYPAMENFIGRSAELGVLTNWYNHAPQMLALIANSGMGKTSLAWHFLKNNVLPKHNFKGVIWWSFCEQDSEFENFLNKAITYVSGGKIDPASFSSEHDQMMCLSYLLTNQRFLIILDGVEQVMRGYANLYAAYQADNVNEDRQGIFRTCKNPIMSAFLENMADESVKTKTLITSRLFPRELDRFTGCNRYFLRRFSTDEATEFFNSERIKGDRDKVKPIATPLGHHPLSLRLLIGILKEDPEYKLDLESSNKIEIIRHGSKAEVYNEESFRRFFDHIFSRLPLKEQFFLSQFSASRLPMNFEGLKLFRQNDKGKSFGDLLAKLNRRGLLLFDPELDRYDLPPLVRKFAYAKLIDKRGVHLQLAQYWKRFATAVEFKTTTDYNPLVEVYYHTLRAGNYDEAVNLFNDRLAPLYFVFSAFQECGELLGAIFINGEDKPAPLSEESAQGWARNALALSYSSCGLPVHSIPLMKKAVEIYERRNDPKRAALILENLVQDQMALGFLDDAEFTVRHNLEICRSNNDEILTASAHQDLGQLMAYKGDFEQAKREINVSREFSIKRNNQQALGMDEAGLCIVALLEGNYKEALKSAKKARELADVKHLVRDVIRGEWLLGASLRANKDFDNAEIHLYKALTGSRQTNLIEIQAEILLELAKVRREKLVILAKQIASTYKDQGLPEIPEFKQLIPLTKEIQELTGEALEIANRCQYRLQLADIYLFKAQMILDQGETHRAYRKAERALKFASCGYVPVMLAAKAFMDKVSN